MIAIDLSKQRDLDVDPKAMQRINFTANLGWTGNTAIFFIIEEGKENILDFSQKTVKILWMSLYDSATACSTISFYFNMISV